MRILSTLLLCILLSACGGDPFWLPRADRITIQQGNLLSERQLESVKIGMNKTTVRNLLGSPVSSSPFHENRWDYIYTRGPAGSAVVAKKLVVYFENDNVSKLDDNADEQSGELPEHRNWWEVLFPPKREKSVL